MRTISFLVLAVTAAGAQTIHYKAGVAKLPSYCEGIVKAIMTSSGVTTVYVTDRLRSQGDQVKIMFDCAEAKTCATYGPEGQAVLATYRDAKKAGKPEAEIKAAMLETLGSVLQSAIENKRMMHLRENENEFITFDISQNSLLPQTAKKKFNEEAARLDGTSIHRYIGLEGNEVNAFHFEIKAQP